jgi:hypothetical protein
MILVAIQPGSKKILRLPGKRIVGAEDRARTGHLDLGKVALYQMSYFRMDSGTRLLSGLFRKNMNDRNSVPISKELEGCKNRY